jgi:hypothetical protein
MPVVYFDAVNFNLPKTAIYYLSGQVLVNPEESDRTKQIYETWQVELRDGANEVSDRAIELIKSHVDAETLITNKILSFGESTPRATTGESTKVETKDVRSLSVKLAEPIIKAETDIKILKEWESDPRTSIKDMVADRIFELEQSNV